MTTRRQMIASLEVGCLAVPLLSLAPVERVWRVGILAPGRRGLAVCCLVALVASRLAVAGSQETQRPSAGPARHIGVLGYGVDPALIEAFRTGLRELGYIEGRDIAFDYRCSEAPVEELPARAAQLVQRKVDVILAVGTPSVRAARAATASIPVVMVSVGLDPVRLGLVQSLSRPGGNVTGLAALGIELWAKRLQLLRQSVRKLSVVAVLSNPANPANVLAHEEIRVAAKNAGIELKLFTPSDRAGLDRALEQIGKGSFDALLCVWDPLFLSHAPEIARFAIQHHLPTMAAIREFVDGGILMCYGAKLPDQYRRAAQYVDRILKGTRPGDLPIEQPMVLELTINGKTAKALGLTIPPEVLVQADKVIE